MTDQPEVDPNQAPPLVLLTVEMDRIHAEYDPTKKRLTPIPVSAPYVFEDIPRNITVRGLVDLIQANSIYHWNAFTLGGHADITKATLSVAVQFYRLRPGDYKYASQFIIPEGRAPPGFLRL